VRGNGVPGAEPGVHAKAGILRGEAEFLQHPLAEE
jgi:hypothetical protein